MIHVTQMSDIQLSWAYGATIDENGIDIDLTENGPELFDRVNEKPYNPLSDANYLISFWSLRNSGCRMVSSTNERLPSNVIGKLSNKIGYLATVEGFNALGDTAAQAICRVVVYREFGTQVDLPDELMPVEETGSDDK